MEELTPAQMLAAAADLIEKRASQATPGPWRRPLRNRYRAHVSAPLPEDETGVWRSGIDPDTGQRESCTVLTVQMWSNGAHARRRNGRDLEWAAMMNPLVGPPLARLLREEAARVGKYRPDTQEFVVHPDWLELASAILAKAQRGDDWHPDINRFPDDLEAK